MRSQIKRYLLLIRYEELNAEDAHEITAIDKRTAEPNVEREQMLQRKLEYINEG